MKEKFKLYGSIFILVIFVPFLLMLWVEGGFGGRQADPVQQQIEEALPFVVAKEVSVGSRTETLKAQAVIARTNLWGMYLKNQSDDAQGKRDWPDPGGTEDLMTLWGASAYEKNMEKFRQAVKETRGEILTVEHQPIQAAYHYAANCKTRNASEVPGQEAAVYLQSVDSPDDMLADGFLSISYMEKQQMADALASLFQEDAPQAENLPGALELTVRDSAGYVTEVTCGRTVANGEAGTAFEFSLFLFFRAGWKDTDFDKRHRTWARSEPVRCQ